MSYESQTIDQLLESAVHELRNIATVVAHGKAGETEAGRLYALADALKARREAKATAAEGWLVVDRHCLVRRTSDGPEYAVLDGRGLTCALGGSDVLRPVPVGPARWLIGQD